MGTTISGTVSIGVSLSATYNPLLITGSGVVSSLYGAAVYGSYAQTWTVANYGTIIGGTIAGGTSAGYGIDLVAGGTVTNAGTIAGANGVAVQFGGPADLLIVDPGAVFIGAVVGGYGANTLELAAGPIAGPIGTLTGFAAGFVNFTTIIVEPGADWLLDATSTIGTGVLLTDAGTLTNAGAIGSTVTIAGIGSVSTGAFYNSGTVVGYYDGVHLLAGGTVNNSAGGSISGSRIGVDVVSGAAVVSNAGTIVGGTQYRVDLLAAGTIANAGTIAGYAGVNLAAGGTVGNAAGGLISATSATGVRVAGGPGTVINAGTIGGGTGGNPAVQFTGAYADRLIVDPGAVFIGNVAGNYQSTVLELAAAPGASGTLSGFGTGVAGFATIAVDPAASWLLDASGTLGNGITLAVSGTLTSAGTIGSYAVVLDTATLANTGTIGSTVTLTDAGLLANSGTIGVTVTVTGAGSLSNSGVISAYDYAVRLLAGGAISNTAGGLVSGGKSGVTVPSGGTAASGIVLIGNAGTITGTALYGIDLHAAGVVANAAGGTISGYAGIDLAAGGTIGNAAGGVISGTSTSGVRVTGGRATVANAGTISGSKAGIYAANVAPTISNAGLVNGTVYGINLLAGGSISNAAGGTISGSGGSGSSGVYAEHAAATIGNAGLISGTQDGVDLLVGGSLTNAAGGMISGSATGVRVAGGRGTVTNAGTLRGGTAAVQFTGTYADRLIVDPGAVFIGNVVGNYQSTVLELAGANGTLSGFGPGFVGFAAIAVDPTASWLIDASSTLGSGITLTVSGTLTSAGTIGHYATVLDTATLANTGTIGSTVTLVDAGLLANSGAIGVTVTVSNAGSLSNSGVIGVYDYAVRLLTGGTISNAAGGLISGGRSGVTVASGIALIANAGTISGTALYGVDLHGAGMVANAAGGTISGYTGVDLAAGGTIGNAAGGVITGTGIAGVRLAGGRPTVVNAGTISGSAAGVYAAKVAATIGNTGLIGGARYGIELLAGGSVTNAAGGTIIGGIGLYTAKLAATVNNAGLISGTQYGIALLAGGSVTNAAGGTISGTGSGAGITIAGRGTVTNAGTIRSGTGGNAAVLFAGTYADRLIVDPGAMFVGNVVGNYQSTVLELAAATGAAPGASGTVSGFGTGFAGFGTVAVDPTASWLLDPSDTLGTGVTLAVSGTLTNASTIGGYAVVLDTATLVNTGMIGSYVSLVDAGLLTNIGTIGVTVTVTGTGSLSNSLVIGGYYYGARLLAGGTVSNAAGGRISGAKVGITVASGLTVSSNVAVIGNAGTISGTAQYGIDLHLAGRVTNAAGGTISGYAGLDLAAGGTLVNAAGGLISGTSTSGVRVAGSPATVANAGTISGGAVGVYAVKAVATIGNSGLISGARYGIELLAGGSVTNAAGGTISGNGYPGLRIAGGPGTLANAGTVSGGTGYAVQFTGTYANRLIVSPGAVFVGNVLGGSGSNVLELTGTAGTLAGFGTSFINFGTLAVDPGAVWDMAGTSGLAGTGSVTIGTGSTLTVDGPVSSTETIALTGTGAVLAIADAPDMLGTISAFAPGQTIDLTNVAYVAHEKATLLAHNVLLITEADGTAIDLHLNPGVNFATHAFTLAAAGTGTDLTTAIVPCYRRGTRILTSRGAIAVEALRTGDHVVLASGQLTPVTWIGHRRIDLSRHRHPEEVRPIRILADAFAPGVPVRDLWLSPDHGVLLQGALIPIKHLLNGRSIAQVAARKIEYWHVELERHDVLLAEGLAAESYLDTGNRPAFANGGGVVALHPDFRPLSWADACAELLQTGPRVAAAKQALFRRAGADPGAPAIRLRVVAEQRTLETERLGTGLWRCLVPPGTRNLRLLSPAWMPAAHYAESLDARRLGVRLFGAAVDGRSLDLDGPAFFAGFHPLEATTEGDCRWTDGDARLVLPIGACEVRLRVGDQASVESASFGKRSKTFSS